MALVGIILSLGGLALVWLGVSADNDNVSMAGAFVIVIGLLIFAASRARREIRR